MTSLTKEIYANFKSWKEFYPNDQVDITKINYGQSWKPLFDELFKNEQINNINEKLSNELKQTNGNAFIHPAPELLFNAFLLTSFDNLKVVFIGQDPYFDYEKHNGKKIHQAMGLSFSVPFGIKTPSSLLNIYSNMVKNNHMTEVPSHGNLECWAHQGCLMLNSALTVLDGTKNRNCHQQTWSWFTNEIIKYISDNKDHVVFVLWGANALDKKKLIDLNKHDVVISSHPSGQSCYNTLREHPAFCNVDHFGKINEYLKKKKQSQIVWNNAS